MFGSDSNAKQIGYLWERLTPMEAEFKNLNNKFEELLSKTSKIEDKLLQPSESKEIAQTAARSATSYRTNVKKIKEEVEAVLGEVRLANDTVQDIRNSVKDNFDNVHADEESIANAISNIKNASSYATDLKEEIESRYDEISALVDNYKDISLKLESAIDDSNEITEINSKVNSIIKNVISNHSKIRELRDEILGYDDENEDGEPERIEGLRDELESSYKSLKLDCQSLYDDFEDLRKYTKDKYDSFTEDSMSEVNNMISGHEKQYQEVYSKIEKLLPAALTTGLSAAYDEKISSEEKQLASSNSTFTNAIRSLVLVSLIPFAVDLYLLVGLNKDLVAVISDTPKLLLSILPLYLPIFWIAYSSNKKVNLSKRLIEEYTHKGVLSKTFEGLSTQIEELKDDSLSSELRVKLLFNILSVNAENPGKLISDYKTTDHPIMDALDKSVKLANAVEKLKNIPGFSKLVNKLDKDSKDIFLKTEQKVNTVLSQGEEIDKDNNTEDAEPKVA